MRRPRSQAIKNSRNNIISAPHGSHI